MTDLLAQYQLDEVKLLINRYKKKKGITNKD